MGKVTMRIKRLGRTTAEKEVEEVFNSMLDALGGHVELKDYTRLMFVAYELVRRGFCFREDVPRLRRHLEQAETACQQLQAGKPLGAIVGAHTIANQQITINKLLQSRGYLYGLLAVIHRDGGHHCDYHGEETSVAEAMKKVSNWILLEDESNESTSG